MVQCFIQTCRNRSDGQNARKRIYNIGNKLKVSFHSFPKNPATRKEWLDILGPTIPSTTVPDTARICSDHFEEKDFDRSSFINRLRPNALPSKRLIIHQISTVPLSHFIVAEPPVNDENPVKTVSQKVDLVDNSSKIDHLLMPIKIENAEEIDIWSSSTMPNIFPSQSSTSKVDKATMVTKDLTDLSEKRPLPKQIVKVDKETMVSPELIYYSPEMFRLRRRIKFLQAEHTRKMRTARQKIRRYKDQVDMLKSILGTLKNNVK
ncbi:uncharacterized protein [Temnothorax longispinosus]|uniref:THAP-type domain-containing protein n=1 Tax=Temnothorax longispinosus TaxID=300112 RepID=A0A4S2KZN7_9HYME|nr:hypothetical protein DBV15_01364 [Temnothorax longispinosus]